METSVQPLLLGVKDAAKTLGISPFTVRSWIYRGSLKTVNIGSRVLIPATELQRVAEHGLQKA